MKIDGSMANQSAFDPSASFGGDLAVPRSGHRGARLPRVDGLDAPRHRLSPYLRKCVKVRFAGVLITRYGRSIACCVRGLVDKVRSLRRPYFSHWSGRRTLMNASDVTKNPTIPMVALRV
jgi:hypothetical protein